MKRVFIFTILTLILAFAGSPRLAGQPQKQYNFRGTYYDIRRAAHESETVPAKPVVFLGNSITEQGWWKIILRNDRVVNRGIGGDNTFGMVDRLDNILKLDPSVIFIMAGINDLANGWSEDTIAHNMAVMIDKIQASSKDCRIFIQSVLPVNEAKLAFPGAKGKNPAVASLNSKYQRLCKEKGVTFLEIGKLLSDTEGSLKAQLSRDGLHLEPEGYLIWADYLLKNVLKK